MPLIAIITIEQRDLLIGQEYKPLAFFNPNSTDLNDNYFIGAEEVNGCTNEDFQWVNDLTLTEYQPKPMPATPF